MSISEFAQALRKLPGKRDLKDATNALTRLQQIYRGEADFTRPTADNTQDVLTGKLSAVIGCILGNRRDNVEI